MASYVPEPTTYPMVARGKSLFAVVAASSFGMPPHSFMTATKGAFRIPEWILDQSRLAIIGECFLDNGNPSAFQVRFQVKDWGSRLIWIQKEQLRAFFTRHHDDFLWACTVDSGWTRGMLIRLFKRLDENVRVETYYKSSNLTPLQAQQVEESVDKHIRWLEGETAMNEKERKRERGECAGCPGAMMCWGGEQLVGEDCVICGRMFLARQVEGGATEQLGEIKKACTEVAWRKDVCDDCKPGYRETVNETLYALLQKYEE
jgi:hypothetical protein